MCDDHDESSNLSEDEEEGWEEETDSTTNIVYCLFCDMNHSTVQLTLDHCRNDHGIDMNQLRLKLKLDFYGWIKLINYIRLKHPSVDDINKLVCSDIFNNESTYLSPVINDDPLLQVDLEEEEEQEEERELSLKDKLAATELQLAQTKASLENTLKDLETMKSIMRELTLADTDITSSKIDTSEDDGGYFSGYSYYGIHEEMLKDDIRTESYELFISKNSKIFKDKIILDIGCGTGILSLFAIRAGASHVYAIDQSDIIDKAQEIAKENGYDDSVITFIKGQVEKVQLPVEKVDVIISEWMGYFMLFESMLDTVLYARDKWLRNPNNVYPNKCSMSLVAMGDGYEYNCKVNYWDNVRGFKMSCMKEEVLKEPSIRLVDEYTLISSADVIKKFNLSRITVNDLDFETNFTLTIKQKDTCYGLVGYFDVSFDVPDYCVHFSTGPLETPTHWQQTVFFLKEPVNVMTGDLLRGTIKCNKNKSSSRSLDVYIIMKHVPLSADIEPRLLVDHTYTLS